MTHPLFPVPGVLAACLALAGCVGALPLVGPEPTTSVRAAPGEGPPGAAPGSCWGKIVAPAVIETVTEQVLVQPAQLASDGTVIHPAVFRSSTRQAIVRERREEFFEMPCPEVMTPEFIASVQRALKARNLYHGAISGAMDARTRRALRAFQAPDGADADLLTLKTARRLGLVAWDLAGAD